MKSTSRMFTLALVGLFAAVTVIFSQISFPLPSGIPVTLQTFAVALCGYLLGAAYGSLTIVIYLLLGVVGLPVFTGFRGGIGVLFGVTGGYLWSFPLFALCCGIGGFAAKRISHKLFGKALAIACGCVGLAICHLLGAFQFSLISGNGFLAALATASLPYLVKDAVSLMFAYSLAVLAAQALARAGLLIGKKAGV